MTRGCILSRRNKNGTKTYYIKFRTADGTQVKRAAGRRRKDAEQALTEALGAVDRGDFRTLCREAFANLADAWLAAKRPRIEAATYRDYEIHLRLRLKPAFGQLKVKQITRAKVEAYLADLDANSKLSRKTINDSLIPLHQILARAVREGAISTNPAEDNDRDSPLALPYESPTMHYLNREQALRYLGNCHDWYRPLAEVLIGAGLRIGEAIALEWRDVDWDGAALSITRAVKPGGIGTPKGDRGRNVMLAPYLLDLLRDERKRQLDEGRISSSVFVSPQGAQLDRDNVRRRGHQPALKAAALPASIRLHDLRHTAATLWLAAGESIYFVQQQLGHRDIQTTIDLYGHPDQDAHRMAAERAARWWREGVSG